MALDQRPTQCYIGTNMYMRRIRKHESR